MIGATLQAPFLVVGLGATGASVLRFCAGRGLQADATDDRAAPPGIEALREAHPASRFAVGAFAAPRPVTEYGAVVLSPGVSPQHAFVREIAAAGIPVVGDIELFAQTAEAPIVAITGSNGKSTTTALLGAMAGAADVAAGVGGNLGTPALDLLAPDVELYVLEVSSFQLETTHSLAAAAATVLNLSEDHLDRHGDMAAYAAAKARVYRHCGTAVINRDDPATAAGSEGAARSVSFGLDRPASNDAYGMDAGWLMVGDERLIAIDAMRMRGAHNHANALAALALAEAASLPRAACLRALAGFDGLPHRCRLVHASDAVQWLDDSKATNVGAASAALAGMAGTVVWIGGGQAKGQDFAPLAAVLAPRARVAIVYGQDAAVLEDALAGGGVPTRRVATLEEAVAEAANAALPGDTVLLSPACASLDQFSDYRARGERFAQLAREMAA
ncbi:UDP-N-acetylmuramoyl-L-alanine--D-glutamate ligase [Algiphilus sp.]|uniref:UDP-N-acetylmuramoyl-L-alanine--D-glutamate ligase n=1 Tax=Algiphilus sp. TaxID=1872431 RepID=UPI0025C0A1E2|nr:UDP-N-acetylmuramoyl-L-alanine--D-glutamate ligase [Algiphilus sp.]MCK5768998.1 UDP-N-acetylmuramoyl-L-alanine--D-glutamate ligase [Algiphilus sp.]